MRSLARVKSHGEVFTPPALVEEMLARVPEHLWSDPERTFADPSGCGNGNFLVAVVRRRIEAMVGAGISPDKAALRSLLTTFGVDIMQDNVDECRSRLLKQAEESSGEKRSPEWVWAVLQNVVCADALTYDFEFKDPRPNLPTIKRGDCRFPVMVSLPCDHHKAAEYARFMQSRGSKDYNNAYLGARWELTFCRELGEQYLELCIKHLDNDINGRTTDYTFDITVNGVKIDLKAAFPQSRRLESNLIVNDPQPDVTYVLGEVATFVHGEKDMTFTCRGASTGESSRWTTKTRFAPGTPVAKKLEDYVWLRECLKL